MEKQRKTFLSYSRANKDFAVRLAKELKAEGFPVWLDQLDIPPGSRWDAEVEKALTESDIFMVIMTQASIQSDNVLDEIGYAIDNGKRFLPVLLEKCTVPLRLRRFQYVDFTDKSFDEGVESAKELLRTLIAQPTIPREAPTDAPQTVSEQKAEARDDPNSTASKLRQEKIEQEVQFRQETERLQKEKADLEKKLKEEHDTHERMEAAKPAKVEAQPLPSKGQSRLIGVFGISILVIAIAGFAAFKLFSRPAAASIPTETQALSQELPAATEAAVIPITAKDSPVPATEASTVEEVPTATEVSMATEAPAATAGSSGASTGSLASEMTDDKGIDMLLVPEGPFPMGNNRGETYEQPVHQVSLDAYYIDKYEVTNKAYKACVDDGQCTAPKQLYFFEASPNKLYFGVSEYDNYPVVFVDWNMAKTFCQWRGARLPTEAEWEKAALGDTGNLYPWGKDLDCQKANYQKCVNRTSEVGSYPDGVSPYGVFDMTGNVWEWVADWYADNYYANSPAKNPQGPVTGQSRVIRGGSWARFDVTAYHRKNFAPDYNTFDIGFRCASTP